MAMIQPENNNKKSKGAMLWNILTLAVLLAVVCLVAYFMIVYLDPHSVANLFPPAQTPTVFSTETPTITPIQLPPTWTPTMTVAATSTRTRAPTWTLLPGLASETFTPSPSVTLTPSLTTTSMPASALITYHPATDIYPEVGCTWLGVGGLVIGLDGNPLTGQFVQLGGSLSGTAISQLKVSGSTALYGTSGFEFVLGDTLVASTGTLYIQLFDPLGNALTGKIYFDTFDDCARSLVKVTFTRTR